MGLRRGWNVLLETPPISWVASLVGIWRQVYGGMGTDPTYQPQRSEDRLAEARRIVAGEGGFDRMNCQGPSEATGKGDPAEPSP